MRKKPTRDTKTYVFFIAEISVAEEMIRHDSFEYGMSFGKFKKKKEDHFEGLSKRRICFREPCSWRNKM